MLPSTLGVAILAVAGPALCSGLQVVVEGASAKPPVIDAVLFNNEQDMYALRVNELSPAVDIFMVFEGVCSFKGAPKKLTFDKNDPRFGEAGAKIMYLEAPCFGAKDPWENEASMRKHILQSIKTIMPSTVGPGWLNGAVMISDVDEIPMAKKLNDLFEQHAFWVNMAAASVYRIRGQTYFYSVRCVGTKRSAVDWKGTHIMSGKRVDNDRGFEVARARLRASDFDVELEDGAEASKVFIDLFESGWHFSFFLSPEDFRHKLETYSHQAYNKPPYTDLDNIRHKQAACIDPFNRHDYPTWKLKDSMHWTVPKWLPEAVKKGLLPKYWLTGAYD